nr:MAG TPA: ubiquitin-binding zinc finger protein [Caudoviricetes sp.]
MFQWLYEKITGRCWHVYSLEERSACYYKCIKCGRRISR